MARYGMVIDINKCNGCYNCFLACKDEYTGNDYPPYSLQQPNEGKPWMKMTEKEMGTCPKVKVDYIPQPCLHCGDAPCVEKAVDGEVYRRPDGIVLIDPEKAAGKREVITYCPHRVISWNEAQNVPQKCTFCVHLLENGAKEPRCVEGCPSGALLFGDLDDPESEISKLAASNDMEELNPAYNLNPNVLYRNLPKRFIAGEVILEDKQEACAEGIKVTLKGDSLEAAVATDFLGDFEFKGLETNRVYQLTVEADGYKPQTIDIKTDTDKNLGEVLLKRA
ncbi:4Fe-4S dicluster domain-containing protein [Thermodesulfobacteriota bacterium]